MQTQPFNLQKSPEIDIILEFIKKLHPNKVLEPGANFGRELKYLEGIVPHLYGIDLNREKVQFGKTYVKAEFRIADASNIPYKDNKFDFVYTDGIFAHSAPEKIKAIMDEIFRVSSKYILLVEYVGTHLSRNTVGNCKQNTWIHDYNKLVSGYDVMTKYNEKMFYGTDCFQVILLKKEIKKREEFIFVHEVPQERKFEIKIGKFRVGF